MASVTLRGTTTLLDGELPALGAPAPDFTLVDSQLQDRRLADFSHGDYADRNILIYCVPSLDTPLCAKTTRELSALAANRQLLVLLISADLPFAQQRFCKQHKLSNIETLSLMRARDFASQYGVLIAAGPLAGLTARAVFVLDEKRTIIYRELVDDIAQAPDFTAALAVASGHAVAE